MDPRQGAAGPASKPRPKAPRVSADLDESAAADLVLSAVQQAAAAASAEEEAETAQFANYAPKFVKEGAPHPDPCVETSTLAAVAPPQPTYKHHLADAVAKGTISSLQLESVIYAFQRFGGPKLPDGSRAGFWLGDGAGVGKGRQLAAAAFEHMRCGGKRVLWISVSSDLRVDAARDLDDLGLEQLPLYPPRTSSAGVLPTGNLDALGYKDGVAFFTYSLLISSSAKGSRLEQIVDWLQHDKSPLIIFDESHKAKNLGGVEVDGKRRTSKAVTATAKAVVALQQALPGARVIYASATGASTPSNLRYMTRLGDFGMADFLALLSSLSGAGLGSLELFSMGMKATGAYVCRTLSYEGAEFELAEVPLSAASAQQYDHSCTFWTLLVRVFEEARAGQMLDKKSSNRFSFRLFWGAHQRFYRQMLLAAKVPALAAMAAEAVSKKGMAVVIGLQSTGEANTSHAAEEAGGQLDDWVSTPQIVLQRFVNTAFPTTVSSLNGRDFRNLYKEVLAVTSLWHKGAAAAAAAGGGAGAAAAAGPAQPAAAAAAAAAASSDDDDVILVAEKTFDEMEAERLLQAKQRGDYFDFSGDVDDEALQQAELEALNARREAEAAAGARREAEHARIAADRAAVRAMGGGALEAAALAAAGTPPPPAMPKAPDVGAARAAARADRAAARASRVIVVDSDCFSSGGSEDEEEEEAKRGKKSGGKRAAGPASGGPAARRVKREEEEEVDDAMCLGDTDDEEEEMEAAGGGGGGGGLRSGGGGKGSGKKWKSKKEEDAGSQEEEEEGEGEREVQDKWLLKIRAALVAAVGALDLPPCPLDHLIDLLGGPVNVAEMTGRKDQLTKDAVSGAIGLTSRRAELGVAANKVNLHERAEFQAGRKLIAIISDAASTGISLQADKRAGNQRRRLHLTLELPWSADKAIQQFGRSHRSNQASAPVYRILVTDLGGERRFAASAAKRLLSLGALLRADRNALGAGVSLRQFDIESGTTGGLALKRFYYDVMARSVPLAGVSIPGGDMRAFRVMARRALVSVGLAQWSSDDPPFMNRDNRSITVDKDDLDNIPRFLNRMLGMECAAQKKLFAHFSETFDAVVVLQKNSGQYDSGVVDVKSESITACPGFPRRIHTDSVSGAETHVVKLRLDVGVSFDGSLKHKAEAAALSLSKNRPVPPENGYWVSKTGGRDGRPHINLLTEVFNPNRNAKPWDSRRFRVCKPGRGWEMHYSGLLNIQKEYVQTDEATARRVWDYWYDWSLKQGARITHVHLIHGAVLPVWAVVSAAFAGRGNGMQVVRTQTDDGQRFVGLDLGEDERIVKRIVGAVEAYDAAPHMFDADELREAAMADDEAEASLGDDWED